MEITTGDEIEVKQYMVQLHQEIKLAESILIDEKTDKDIMEFGVKINVTEMMRYKNMVNLDPGPEKAVYS